MLEWHNNSFYDGKMVYDFHFTLKEASLSPHLRPKFQLKAQSVPRSKHPPSLLYKPVS